MLSPLESKKWFWCVISMTQTQSPQRNECTTITENCIGASGLEGKGLLINLNRVKKYVLCMLYEH